jgi:hypothetical protein
MDLQRHKNYKQQEWEHFKTSEMKKKILTYRKKLCPLIVKRITTSCKRQKAHEDRM